MSASCMHLKKGFLIKSKRLDASLSGVIAVFRVVENLLDRKSRKKMAVREERFERNRHISSVLLEESSVLSLVSLSSLTFA